MGKKTLGILVISLSFAFSVYAQVPQLINYQGMLTDSQGNPVNGDRKIQFQIWSVPAGIGIKYWQETQTVVIVNGYFNVLLGSVRPISFAVFDGQDKYLAMKVGDDPWMAPRKRLVSVGYAFRAYEADKVDGKDGSAFIQSVNNVPPNNAGNVDLVAGDNITVTPSNTSNSITISSSSGGVTLPYSGNFESRRYARTITDIKKHAGTLDGWGTGVYGDAQGGYGGYFSSDSTGVMGIGWGTEAIGVHGFTLWNGRGVYGSLDWGDSGGYAGYFEVFESLGTRNGNGIYAKGAANGHAAKFVGDVLIETGRVSTPVLEITGGMDLSEQFEIRGADSTGTPIPGMLVSIDPENPGSLVISTRAYDQKVAGIISGAGGVKPGMRMGQKGSEADTVNAVALTGRVYCLADASNGAIQVGDLLTTSDTPGHAMKVIYYSRAQGAIIGKAMSSLDAGRGLVLVLVSLQ